MSTVMEKWKIRVIDSSYRIAMGIKCNNTCVQSTFRAVLASSGVIDLGCETVTKMNWDWQNQHSFLPKQYSQVDSIKDILSSV